MTQGSDGSARDSRSQRRIAARMRVQKRRSQHRRRQRTTRIVVRSIIAAVLVAIVAVVAVVLTNSSGPAGPGPKSMTDGGITLGRGLKPVDAVTTSPSPSSSSNNGSDTVHITMYVDYLCPLCGSFDRANGKYIQGLVKSGAATVDIHPVAVLSSRSQGTKYSLRAANAAACVAQSSPNTFWAANRALFSRQPDVGTSGLTDKQLIRTVTGVQGTAHPATIARCIERGRYSKWVDEQTTKVSAGKIPGSHLDEFPGAPLVLVNGQKYEYAASLDNSDFRRFVVTVAGKSFATSDSTETPTPTSTPAATSTPTATPTPSASSH